MTEDDAKELLQNLIGWLVRSLEDGSGTLVIRKLCSALSTYFIYFSHLWPRCVGHLAHCLSLGRALAVGEPDSMPETSDAIGALTVTKLQAALWFATSLVEDTGKTDMNSQK